MFRFFVESQKWWIWALLPLLEIMKYIFHILQTQSTAQKDHNANMTSDVAPLPAVEMCLMGFDTPWFTPREKNPLQVEWIHMSLHRANAAKLFPFVNVESDIHPKHLKTYHLIVLALCHWFGSICNECFLGTQLGSLNGLVDFLVFQWSKFWGCGNFSATHIPHRNMIGWHLGEMRESAFALRIDMYHQWCDQRSMKNNLQASSILRDRLQIILADLICTSEMSK